MDEQKKSTEQEDKAKAEKRKGLVLMRRTRRKQQRASAKANGHKLGHNNRKCKLCGVTRASGFGGECSKQLPAAGQ